MWDVESLREAQRLRLHVGVCSREPEIEGGAVAVAEGVLEGAEAVTVEVGATEGEGLPLPEGDAVVRVPVWLHVRVAVRESDAVVVAEADADAEEALRVAAVHVAVVREGVREATGDGVSDAVPVGLSEGGVLSEAVGEPVHVRTAEQEREAVWGCVPLPVPTGVADREREVRVEVPDGVPEAVKERPRECVGVTVGLAVPLHDTEGDGKAVVVADAVTETGTDAVAEGRSVALQLRVGVRGEEALMDGDGEDVLEAEAEGVREMTLREGPGLGLGVGLGVRVGDGEGGREAEAVAVVVRVAREGPKVHVMVAVECDGDHDGDGVCDVRVKEGGERDGVRVPEGGERVREMTRVPVHERKEDALELELREAEEVSVGDGVPVGLGVWTSDRTAVREQVPVAEEVRVGRAVAVGVGEGEPLDVPRHVTGALGVPVQVLELMSLRDAERLEAEGLRDREAEAVPVGLRTHVQVCFGASD